MSQVVRGGEQMASLSHDDGEPPALRAEGIRDGMGMAEGAVELVAVFAEMRVAERGRSPWPTIDNGGEDGCVRSRAGSGGVHGTIGVSVKARPCLPGRDEAGHGKACPFKSGSGSGKHAGKRAYRLTHEW